MRLRVVNPMWLCIVIGLSAGFRMPPAAAQTIDRQKYPQTPTEEVKETIHGVEIVDPYRWLEDDDSPRVKEWVEGQGQFTRSLLDKFEGRDKIHARLETLFGLTVSSAPAIYGQRYFFTRREKGQNHAVLYVRQGSFDAPAKVVLDPNAFSADGTVALDWYFPSPDGSLVAYGKSAGGTEKSTLYIRDVEKAVDLPDAIPGTRFATVAWSADGKGFYYTRYPAPGSVPEGDENYYQRVYSHRLGQDAAGDPLIHGADRPKEETCDVYTSNDRRFVFLSRSTNWIRNDLFIKKNEPGGEFRPVADGLDGQFSAEIIGDQMIVLTDYQAPRYRVVSTPVDNPDITTAKEIIPQQKGVIKGMEVADNKLAALIREDVHSRLFIYSPEGKRLDEVQLPTLGTVGGVRGKWDGKEAFMSFSSFAYPSAVLRYDLEAKKLTQIEQMQIGTDLSAYETKQEWYASKDGTRVPMFIVHRKGMKLDGGNPTMLYGYGGFDISIEPAFSPANLVWLEAGGVFAVANIRGGGEFGREWHESGRNEKKQNVFDDFIGAAEWLIANKYTRPDRLAIRGGSNGGLLVAAVMVQRPELFGAVVCQVPLIDMLRYHLFSIARLWIPEYGTAEKEEDFKWLQAYSPYQHVKKDTKYPATLVMTGESDTRVDPLHARKFAARLQAATSANHPILLRVESKSGHGQGMPVSKSIDVYTDIFTFLMWQFDMKPAT